ncbi:MAG: fluoride efflux transporter CrcB [Burkholderiales bacterium]
MWHGFAAVGIGAVLGAWLRWWLGLWFNAATPNLPAGTLLANLIGGYLIGMALQYFSTKSGLPPEMRLFVITGFLGALTTFSSFSAEAVGLLSRGEYGWALAHSLSHLIGSLVATFAGIATLKVLQS